MAKPLLLQTTKTGIEICSGKPKLIIIGNWYSLDKETGYITQKSIDGVLHALTSKLIDMKFTSSKDSENNLMFLGDTMIIAQSPRASGKKLNRRSAEMTARAILAQCFQYFTKTGYFDEVDPEKLQQHLEDEANNKDNVVDIKTD